jgi:hypothetical protein
MTVEVREARGILVNLAGLAWPAWLAKAWDGIFIRCGGSLF